MEILRCHNAHHVWNHPPAAAGSLSRGTIQRSLCAVGQPCRAARRVRPSRRQPARRFGCAHINHFGLAVSDPKRSVDFYQGLFGMPVQARVDTTTILRVGAGPQFISIAPAAANAAPSINHYCLGIENFAVDRVLAALAAHGVTKGDAAGPMKVAVTVRDGTPDLAVRRSGWDRVSAAGRQLLRWIRPARERVPDCRAVAKERSARAPRSEPPDHFFDRRRTLEHVLPGSVRSLDSLVPGSDRAHAGHRSDGGVPDVRGRRPCPRRRDAAAGQHQSRVPVARWLQSRSGVEDARDRTAYASRRRDRCPPVR